MGREVVLMVVLVLLLEVCVEVSSKLPKALIEALLGKEWFEVTLRWYLVPTSSYCSCYVPRPKLEPTTIPTLVASSTLAPKTSIGCYSYCWCGWRWSQWPQLKLPSVPMGLE
jgi:hypothetical protein